MKPLVVVAVIMLICIIGAVMIANARASRLANAARWLCGHAIFSSMCANEDGFEATKLSNIKHHADLRRYLIQRDAHYYIPPEVTGNSHKNGPCKTDPTRRWKNGRLQ